MKLASIEAITRALDDAGVPFILNFQSDKHRDTPVDVFVTEPFDFDEEYRLAMVEDLAPGAPVRILRLESLLRLKQAAGRPQDLADIAELRLLHGEDPNG
jgi:hypothetical protein